MEKNIRNLRIGDILKEYGYVSDAQIGEAIAYQKEHKGVRIGGALIALGCISEDQLLQALGPVSYTHLDVYKRQVLWI